MIKFIELFSGIGGFRNGLERCVGAKCTNKKSKPSKSKVFIRGEWAVVEKESSVLSSDNGRKRSVYNCVFANEIDKYASQIYKKNFGEGELYEGDITKISADDIPDHELLVGGVPCQAWSIAGKRKGFEDSRGTMWFECFRIIKAKKPKYLFLENVKGILSHNGGNSFERICECICELGYAIDFEVLNSKNFGVPQSRERVFIIGIRLDLLDKYQIF